MGEKKIVFFKEKMKKGSKKKKKNSLFSDPRGGSMDGFPTPASHWEEHRNKRAVVA